MSSYFPMQNDANTWPRTSSGVIAPEIAPVASSARRSEVATSSGVRRFASDSSRHDMASRRYCSCLGNYASAPSRGAGIDINCVETRVRSAVIPSPVVAQIASLLA